MRSAREHLAAACGDDSFGSVILEKQEGRYDGIKLPFALAAIEQAQREAVEAAAKVADGFFDNSMKMVPPMQQKIAAAIRALAPPQDQP